MSENQALLDIARLEREIVGQRIGRRLDYRSSTTSTNDIAWDGVEQGDADGLVVLAEHQSSGRGRLGRTWSMPNAAGVLASVVICYEGSEREIGSLGLMAAIAVCDAVAGSASVAATIKWPNDILVGELKIAGILIETRSLSTGGQAAVVGIGINCLQHPGHFGSDIANLATSLDIESDRPVDRTAVAAGVLRELDGWVGKSLDESREPLRAAWRARTAMLGERIRLRHDGVIFSGSVLDIDPTSDLLIKLDEGGVRSFAAADTTVIRADADGR